MKRISYYTSTQNRGKENIETHRGTKLSNIAYEIYLMVLSERLSEEVESKGILPEMQAGFRIDRSTIENIYILEHVLDKELAEGGKVCAFFVARKGCFHR